MTKARKPSAKRPAQGKSSAKPAATTPRRPAVEQTAPGRGKVAKAAPARPAPITAAKKPARQPAKPDFSAMAERNLQRARAALAKEFLDRYAEIKHAEVRRLMIEAGELKPMPLVDITSEEIHTFVVG